MPHLQGCNLTHYPFYKWNFFNVSRECWHTQSKANRVKHITWQQLTLLSRFRKNCSLRCNVLVIKHIGGKDPRWANNFDKHRANNKHPQDPPAGRRIRAQPESSCWRVTRTWIFQPILTFTLCEPGEDEKPGRRVAICWSWWWQGTRKRSNLAPKSIRCQEAMD